MSEKAPAPELPDHPPVIVVVEHDWKPKIPGLGETAFKPDPAPAPVRKSPDEPA